MVDPAWNVTSSGRHSIVVSSRKLSAPHTGTRTVTALASFDVWYNDDDCSQLFLSSWAPGALHWDACSGGSVLSWHHLTLPTAVKYGSVRVSTYARGAGSSSAFFRFIDDDDTYLGGNTFDADQETHRSSSTPITSDLLTGQRVRWAMLVQDGDAYAATTFTVTWTYYVLE